VTCFVKYFLRDPNSVLRAERNAFRANAFSAETEKESESERKTWEEKETGILS